MVREVRNRTSERFLVCVRISPEHEVGVTLTESLELSKMMGGWDVDMIHISCWDAFKGPQGEDDPRTITRIFRDELGADAAIISTGSVWDASDAQFVIDEGADMVGVARVAIAHSEWATGLSDGGYSPERPPFTPEHLMSQGLSQVFVDYMRRWKGFVTDGRSE